ncbi:MAG: acyltransferase [Muribaculum sp.]|nr:acyltransferase [Muribaculum sp.]
MDTKNKLSLTYRLLRKVGLNYSEEEYGQVTLWQVISKFFSNPYHALLNSMMDWVIFDPIAPRMLRPWLLRRMGAKVAKGVFIGDHCHFDQNHADHIILEENVHIASGTRILCHLRNLKDYHMGDDYAKLPYRLGEVRLCKGCCVGMESMVMPGVTVGEGAIVGAASLVSKDIPAWTIAVGSPAKPVKNITE